MNPESFNYWKIQFNSAVFTLNLPVDSSPSQQQIQSQRAEAEILFSESLSQSIQSPDRLLEPFCKGDESLLIIFLAIYSIVLSRYTSQTDIVIGTLPIHDDPTLEDAASPYLKSPFSNSVGIRVVLEPSMTFRQLLNAGAYNP